MRLDHIGSTSIPGLAAKDVIDIQVSVGSLSETAAFVETLALIGFDHLDHITGDHIPSDADPDPNRWRKRMFVSSHGNRRSNLHIRVMGNPNQAYPLLFRDYLRAHQPVAAGYAQVKEHLARYHPDDLDAYYDIKDPVCDIIMSAASEWAVACGWSQGVSDA